MTTAAELLARTDCEDLRRANAELQRQLDIATGRAFRLNALLVIKESEAETMEAEIDRLRAKLSLREAELADARAGITDARLLGY